MLRVCTLTLLLLVLNCRTKELPSTINSQQVAHILHHLIANLDNYIFPETAVELKKQLLLHQPEYLSITDAKTLAARLTTDLRAAAHDQHLEVSYGDEMGFQKDPTAEQLRQAHALDVARDYGLRSARRLPGNVGYIDLAYFSADPDAGLAIAAAMQVVSGTNALIVDLRRNGGGGPASTILLSYFFSEPTQLSSVEERRNGQIQERQKWTMPYVAGARYTDKPLYVLTSRHTWSAAELCAYDLKTRKRATLVGEVTGGAANSSSGLIALDYGFTALIPDGQTKSPITHTNWEGKGVEPDVVVSARDALVVAYKLALNNTKPNVESEELTKERQQAVQDPQAALAEEFADFPSD